jgi:hypothetical protein
LWNAGHRAGSGNRSTEELDEFKHSDRIGSHMRPDQTAEWTSENLTADRTRGVTA